MNEEQRNRLQLKKEQLKLKQAQFKLQQKEMAITHAKDNVIQNINGFEKKYRFTNEHEVLKIQQLVSELAFERPGQ